ncbi:MAG: putative Ig domain-containing protein [Gammaproteobacteria bacterium]|nr:putative Ig domain-containing protein [Gammaproteobacteria bacterium]
MRKKIIQAFIFLLIISSVALCFGADPNQTLNLNSSQLGFKGPWQSSLEYSDQYGFNLNNKYTQVLGIADAIALELDFGTNEYRLGATWAHMLNLQQRIKITVERLAQKLAFDFASGTTHNWIGQNAIGGEYQYLLNHSWLNSIDIGGYYAKANSKTLSTVTFWQNGALYDNIRHIAGATSENVNFGIDTHPWKTGLVNFNLDYDNVHFNPLYETADNKSGIGGAIALQQLLSKKLKLQLSSSFRQPFDQYQAGLFWLPKTTRGTRLELGLNYAHVNNHIDLPNENRYGIQLTFSWGNKQNTQIADYNLTPNNTENLKTWTDAPVVHMPTVLAMRDQKIQLHTTAHGHKKQINETFPTSQPIPNQHLYSDGKGDYRVDIKKLGDFQPDNLIYTITAEGAPPLQGAHFDSNNKGILIIPKNNFGTFYSTVIRAYNDTGATVEGLTVTIDKTDDPWAEHISDQWVSTAQQYNLDTHTYFHYSHETQPDAHNYLKYSLNPVSTLFNITDKDARISGTIPNDGANSPYNISVKAEKIINDTDSGINTTTTYKLYVLPTASTTTGDYSHAKNSSFTIDAKNDGKFQANGDPQLTFSLDNNAPDWLAIDQNSGAITAKENSSDYGDYTFNVIGNKTTETIGTKQASWPATIKITPLPATIPNQWADANNVNLDIANDFADPNKKLIYSISDKDNLSINQGKITGTLANPNTTPGHTVTVTGKISSGESQAAQFIIYANPALASNGKSLIELPNQQIPTIHAATEGFKNHGNNAWWTYSIEGILPSSLTLNPSTGDINGSAPTATGNYSFNVKAVKTPPGATSKSITWPVTIKIGTILNCPHNPPDPEVLYLPFTKTAGGITFTFNSSDRYTAVDTKNFDGTSLETSGNNKILICKYTHGTVAHLADILVKTGAILPNDTQTYGSYGVIFFN